MNIDEIEMVAYIRNRIKGIEDDNAQAPLTVREISDLLDEISEAAETDDEDDSQDDELDEAKEDLEEAEEDSERLTAILQELVDANSNRRYMDAARWQRQMLQAWKNAYREIGSVNTPEAA